MLRSIGVLIASLLATAAMLLWPALGNAPNMAPTAVHGMSSGHIASLALTAGSVEAGSASIANAQGPARTPGTPIGVVRTPLPTTAPSPSPTSTASPTPTATARPTPSVTSGYWHTNGLWVVSKAGQHVRMVGVTWYGMQNYTYVPAGLNWQHYTVILGEIKRMGFNVIRLPLSNELVERNPIVHVGLRANPDLVGLHALAVLDRIVAAAGQLGLRIILVNHKSSAGRPGHINSLNEALWYTKTVSQAKWIHDWVTLAKRYRGNPTVVGFDLRNEPHTDGPGPWSLKTYLNQGATWGPYRNHDNRHTDWRLAAERAGDAVLKVSPHLLIIVEGVMEFPYGPKSNAVETYWWGSILRGVRQYPVVLKRPHQLVYSPHEWGPRKYPIAAFNAHTSYAKLLSQFNYNWGFILNPRARYRAPIWLGEFGTCNTSVACVTSKKPGTQGQWFQILMRYLKLHPYVGWAFFAVNGTNTHGDAANNGLLNPTWTRPALPRLVQALRRIERP